MRTLNIRLLVILLVGALLTAAVGYGVHGYQVRRNAGTLLRQASAAKEAERWNEAIDCLQRYVALVPRDNGEALAELGLIQADLGFRKPSNSEQLATAVRNLQAAARNLQNALRQLHDRDDLRRRFVDVEIALGGQERYQAARPHLEFLLQKQAKEKTNDKEKPRDPVLLEYLARCQESIGEYDEAVKSFQESIEGRPEGPDSLSAYVSLAAIYELRLQKHLLAQATLDQMVAQNSKEAKAYLFRGNYRLERRATNRGAEGAESSNVPLNAAEQRKQAGAAAIEDARAALKLKPDDQDVLLFAVRCFLTNGLQEDARKYALIGKDLFPKNPTIYALLADIELQSDLGNVELQKEHRKAAIEWLRKGVAVTDKDKQQDLLWNFCNLHLEKGALEGTLNEDDASLVESSLGDLRKAKYPKPPIEFLEAKLKTVRNPRQWLEASTKLERNRGALVPWPDLLQRSDILLGYCYKALGNPDLQLTAFRRAASANPALVDARLGIADALVAINNVDEALREYEGIIEIARDSLGRVNVGVLLQVARAMVASNLRRKSAERDWTSVASLLDQIEQSVNKQEPPDDTGEKRKQDELTEVTILKAEVLFAQDKTPNAIDLLQAARDRRPQELRFWIGLAALAEQRNESAEGLRFLEEAQAKNGDKVALRLARGRLLVNDRNPTAGAELRKLSEPSTTFTTEEKVQLYAGIAGLQFALGDYDETERLCKAVIAERPTDLMARLLLFDAAIRAGDAGTEKPVSIWSAEKRLSVMAEVLQQMLEIDGKSALWNYGSAVELRIKADEAERSKRLKEANQYLKEAKQHLALARAARRRWSRIPRLMAEINRKEGDLQAAVNNYLEAIELGEQNPAILSETVMLLNFQKKFKEADDLIRRLDQQVRKPFSNEMIQLAAEVSLEVQDSGRALDLATNRFKPTDASGYIWTGNVLARLGKLIEAESSFRTAIGFDESRPEAWVALIQFLGTTQQFEKASAEFAEAEKKINRDDVSKAMALCIESTGRGFDEMEARFKATLSTNPNDVPSIRGMVGFYKRQQRFDKAEPLLQQVLRPDFMATAEERTWARRDLALALSIHPERAARLKALELLDENLKSGGATIEDRQAKALILSGFSDDLSKLEAAADLLEELVVDSQLQDKDKIAEERFVLAQVYYAISELARSTGKHAKIIEHMRTLLSTHGYVRRYVEFYAKFLIKTEEAEEATRWLKGLELTADKTQQQDAYSKLSFSAEALLVQGKYDELFAAVDAYVDEPALDAPERRIRFLRSAALMERQAGRLKEQIAALSSRFVDKAEEYLRRNIRDNPSDALSLAGFCSRHRKLDEALEILDRTWSTALPVEITAVTITFMISPVATPQQLAGLEKVLRATLEKFGRDELLVQALADLQSWREEYDEAETLYRESLQKRDHPLALNNLALLLALRGKGGTEPLRMIDKAIELAGSDPSLLDSRATINLALGNPQLARPDLVLAIEKRKDSPLSYFHLAQVDLRLGQKESAKKWMEKANELGLHVENLHPLERKGYRQLQQELR